jgi:hypothetical protein
MGTTQSVAGADEHENEVFNTEDFDEAENDDNLNQDSLRGPR